MRSHESSISFGELVLQVLKLSPMTLTKRQHTATKKQQGRLLIHGWRAAIEAAFPRVYSLGFNL